jgi:putative aldouronate transport system substrate-binding protein
VEYLLDYTEYENKNGKFKIDLEFMVPVAGSEVDNFNTLLSTGEYADIMEMSRYQGSIVELYEDGVIVDLTEYMEEYMPNYMAYLEANPELARTAANLVDGERKYLQLYSYNSSVMDEYWSGYNYRRDWLVKYGENPVDGSKFSVSTQKLMMMALQMYIMGG